MNTKSKQNPNLDDEWGNIELPGLSDEKLLNTNWNIVARNNTESWKSKNKESRKKLAEDLKWAEQHRKLTNEKYADPEYRKRLKLKAELRAQTPEWRETQQKAGLTRKNSKAWYEATIQAQQTESYKKMHKEKSERQQKPFMTRHGAFASKKSAALYYQVDTAMIGYWAKKFPDEFYAITKEEYSKVSKLKPKKFSEKLPHPRIKKQ